MMAESPALAWFENAVVATHMTRVRRLRRPVHPIDSVGMAGRSRGAGSIRCHRSDGVPGRRGGDHVLAEAKEGIEGEAGLAVPMLAQRAVEDSPRWTRARREPA